MLLNDIRIDILQRKSLRGKLLFPIFRMLSLIFCGFIFLRNMLYDKKILRQKSFRIPVISIGNIVAGGVGKTPLTESIYLSLRDVGFSPAVVLNGYKGNEKGPTISKNDTEKFGDEASVYAIKGYLSIVGKNRLRSIELAENVGANVVILDDGFQHREVKPLINIAVIDALKPFGDNYCLPLGLLREPISSLKRADCFVLTRSNLLDSNSLENIERKLLKFERPIFRARQSFRGWVNEDFKATLAPKGTVDVICGIGNPDQFIRMLSNLGLKIGNCLIFNDHHRYTQENVDEILKLKNPVTTEKDLIKLRKFKLNLKAPILTLDVPGLKEFIISHIQNLQKDDEKVIEGNLIPSRIPNPKGSFVFLKKNEKGKGI